PAPGQRLEPDAVSLHRIRDVTAAMAARPLLDTHRRLPPHQVSIPHPLDLALVCFGSARLALQHWPVFRDTVLTDVTTIYQQWPQDVVFQLETPMILALLHRAARPLWPALTTGLAWLTARI